jgi:hypothetical protein
MGYDAGMNTETLEVSRAASHERIAHAGFDILGEQEEQARREWMEALRAEALGCIWPSVVAKREGYVYGTRVVVSGQAFRLRGW